MYHALNVPPCADYVRFGSNFKDISNDCFEITRLKQLRHKVILKVICGCKQYDTFFEGGTSTLAMPDKSASPRRIDILNSRISRGLPHTTYFYVAIRVEQKSSILLTFANITLLYICCLHVGTINILAINNTCNSMQQIHITYTCTYITRSTG